MSEQPKPIDALEKDNAPAIDGLYSTTLADVDFKDERAVRIFLQVLGSEAVAIDATNLSEGTHAAMSTLGVVAAVSNPYYSSEQRRLFGLRLEELVRLARLESKS